VNILASTETEEKNGEEEMFVFDDDDTKKIAAATMTIIKLNFREMKDEKTFWC
jgi:hypothetical protein